MWYSSAKQITKLSASPLGNFKKRGLHSLRQHFICKEDSLKWNHQVAKSEPITLNISGIIKIQNRITPHGSCEIIFQHTLGVTCWILGRVCVTHVTAWTPDVFFLYVKQFLKPVQSFWGIVEVRFNLTNQPIKYLNQLNTWSWCEARVKVCKWAAICFRFTSDWMKKLAQVFLS